MATILHPDPFSAQLLASDPLVVSVEQQQYIREILETSCSDSRFAEKAYAAIWRVLTLGPVAPPVVSSLNPATVVLGSPSFDVHVIGSGFSPTSVIVFAGQDEPTTFISANEVSTGVNMDVWAAPAVVPVLVSTDGVASDPVDFEFTEVVTRSASVKQDVFKDVVKQEYKDAPKASVAPVTPISPSVVKKEK